MTTLLPLRSFCFILFVAAASICMAQSAAQYCVRLTATVQESPARITLNWPLDTAGATSYTVNRKAKAATNWGTILVTLPATATTWTDTLVGTDTAYEYKVRKNGTPVGEGYIFAGIKYPAIEYRGKLLMIVDSFLKDYIPGELNRLATDISGDGWAVQRIDVSTEDKDTYIKDIIRTEYLADSTNVKAVLLVGHIAVPYSGLIYPDGHPDHKGAWPADIYYGNMHYAFRDVNVNDSSASRPANRNVAGDGKWDASTIYGKTELQVSRIDLYNMPAFDPNEMELLKSYLDKDHAYRMKNINVIQRGLIDDNFGGFNGEAFAMSGWRNFSPIIGSSNISAGDYITTLDTANYQWSYGCGGGSYTSAGGIGSTSSFVNKNVKSIFTMLFGSYFGDWDASNNFLRAPLCAPEPALTSCWAGRPHWMFHHMALGENIGYSANLTQNQTGSIYLMNYGIGFVHVALMGDLTLRQNIIAPPAIVALADTNENVTLTWTASADTVLGYHVYRSATQFGRYERVTSSLATDTMYTDVSAGPGLKYYMVRAVRLEQTPSGTYYNMSAGIADTIMVRDTVIIFTSIPVAPLQEISIRLQPNPANSYVQISVMGANGNSNIEVFDAMGRKVIGESYSAAQRQITLSVATLPSGMYVCRIVSGVQTTIKRFEVAH